MDKIRQWGVQSRQLTNTERWLAFWALFAFGFVSIFNVYKLSSILSVIGATFGFELANVGMVMTIGSIVGIIVIFPATWVLRKAGIKITIIVSFAIMMVGTVASLFAVDSTTFLICRAIESFGNQVICVAGPQLMVRIFPREHQGLVMGVWSTWVPVGAIIAFFAVPLLNGAWGWQSLFYFTFILEVITLILLLVFLKMPAVDENVLAAEGSDEKRLYRKSYLASALIMAGAFTCYVFCQAGVTNTFYPTYLQTVKGLDTFASSMPTLVASAISIPVSFITGVISDKLNARKYFAVIPYLLMAIGYATFAFSEDGSMVGPWAYAILLGVCAGTIPMAIRSIIPVLAYDPKKVDYALGLMAWCSPLGLLFVSSYGSVVASLGYQQGALMVLAPVMLVAFVVALFTKNDHKIEPPTEKAPEA